MTGALRIVGIGAVYLVAFAAWMILGGTTSHRASHTELDSAVSSLWGAPEVQAAPELTFVPEATEHDREVVVLPPETVGTVVSIDGQTLPVQTAPDGTKSVLKRKTPTDIPMPLGSSDIDVRLDSDPRRKGFVWYALYAVRFSANYTYEHKEERGGTLRLRFALPNTTAIYDDLLIAVDGVDSKKLLDPTSGTFSVERPIKKGDRVKLEVRYASRGSDSFRYGASNLVQRLENFTLRLHTNYKEIDYPEHSLSPTARTETDGGHDLEWKFSSTMTGQSIGVTMPSRLQPGELASELSFSAPVSLLFYFVVLFVLQTIRKLDIHPINYLMIAAAFFAFHLLFAYSVDHLTVPVAFSICSIVSMVLVVSYLRLVVSTKFALREAAIAQLVYLVLFSLAHFSKGYTGLMITIMAILTLFLLMQTTGRIRFGLKPKAESDPPSLLEKLPTT